MIISRRIRKFRLEKKLSQGDLERATGLRRQYISRVENGRAVPSLGTLEKLAGALRVPLYRFFHQGEGIPKMGSFPPTNGMLASTVEDSLTRNLLRLVRKIRERDRQMLLDTALKMIQLHRMDARASGDD